MEFTDMRQAKTIMTGKTAMKPYSERFIRRFNSLLERVILNNREL